MKIRHIHCNNWFLRDTIAAITLYPFIFYNMKHKYVVEDHDEVARHELVHIEQVKREGWFKFYYNYLTLAAKGVSSFENKYEVEARRK